MPHQTPVKLLLVDDLEENLIALEALLRADDVTTILARSGTEALEQLLVHDVALALIDVQMPGMDGFELAELMRGMARTRFVPIIFVTAGSHDTSRLFQGYDAGAVDFLHKPIEPRILRNKVSTFVALHRQKAQLAEQVKHIAAREREAERLRKELARTLELHELFVAAVGHDLRSPLQTIVGGVALLERAVPDPALSPILKRLASSSGRMARMLDELGELAKARLGGGLTIQTERGVDLVALAESLVADLQTAHPSHRFQISHRGDGRGCWDRVALEKVASNLLTNAVRYGRPDGTIDVAVEGAEQRVRLSVRNEGEVRPDVLPHIFEPFRRGGEGAARREGLGLGLYIVRQLVEAHGGAVGVTSEGGSTTFVVDLPRTPIKPSSAPPG